MTKRLHAIFWIALTFPVASIIFMIGRVATMANPAPSFTAQDAIGFSFLVIMGMGPIGALYGAALYSRRTWFQLVAAGVSLLLGLTYPFIALFGGGLALMGAGICGWSAAFAGIAIAGGIRLAGALTRKSARSLP